MAKQPPGPNWLDHARSFIGVREIKGRQHQPLIVRWWQAMGSHFRDDETPWCGSFVGGILAESGLPKFAKGAAARAWLKYGQPLNRPAYGCIVVFWRGKRSGWSGHVGFVVGRDISGNLMVLGGNQGDAVNIKPFSTGRVLGYRWPSIAPHAVRYDLPLLQSDAKVSTDES